MADYLNRDDVLEVFNDIHPLDYNAQAYLAEIEKLPAADVVEVDVKDLRVKKAIQTLCEFYSTAKKSDYVQNPLAWALYQTWKSFDKMDGGVNDGT